MKAGGRRKRTKENPFGLEKGKEEKRPLLFASAPLRVEFDPIGWIGLPPEDTHSLRRALPSLPLMGAAAWSELFPDFRFNLSQLPPAAVERGRDFIALTNVINKNMRWCFSPLNPNWLMSISVDQHYFPRFFFKKVVILCIDDCEQTNKQFGYKYSPTTSSAESRQQFGRMSQAGCISFDLCSRDAAMKNMRWIMLKYSVFLSPLDRQIPFALPISSTSISFVGECRKSQMNFLDWADPACVDTPSAFFLAGAALA
jgi:hypothetical protein